MAKESKSRYVILGLLAHEPMTGYFIKKKMESSISNFYALSYGQIYPELTRLEKQGFVVMKSEIGENSVLRKVYSITAAGHALLQEWIARPVEEEKIHYDILLKLFFGGHISVDQNIDHIKAFRSRAAAKLEVFAEYEATLKLLLGDSVDHAYYLLTVVFGQKTYKAYIEWADYALEHLCNYKQRGDGYEAAGN